MRWWLLLGLLSMPAMALTLCGGGGPDSFGYRYLDSDTVCPGAPTFHWVEIKGIGTRITTVGDDNVSGPFSLGFEFPYYWYQVTSCYVGSNGCLAFHDRSLAAAPFGSIPGRNSPNNTVAPMMCDLDCSVGGSVWHWNNQDTFILEYDSIRFWSTGGNNTFQVILSRPDSTITFQYREQSGLPSGGWGNNQTGIENASGLIGLNYLSGEYPPRNMYHDSLAVLFMPPESTTLQIHDVGIRNAMNDRNGGFFVQNGDPLVLWAVVRNCGNQTEGVLKTRFKVTRQNGSVVFVDSMRVPALNPRQLDSVVMPATYRLAEDGTYILLVSTRLAGDMRVDNDIATLELRVVTMPANLGYDNGAQSYVRRLGLGNRFAPPVYPCSVGSCRINMQSWTATDCYVGIFDDDGPNGSPGTPLFVDTVSVNAAGWYTVTPLAPIVITDGAFHVCGTAAISNRISFGTDNRLPLSFQGWEYAGAWVPSVDMIEWDVCANATVYMPVGTKQGSIFDIARARPVPTIVHGVLWLPRHMTESFDDSDRAPRPVLLDISGRKMLDLGPGPNDVCALAPGVYFVRSATGVAKVVLPQ